jgi:hypothetical protein
MMVGATAKVAANAARAAFIPAVSESEDDAYSGGFQLDRRQPIPLVGTLDRSGDRCSGMLPVPRHFGNALATPVPPPISSVLYFEESVRRFTGKTPKSK